MTNRPRTNSRASLPNAEPPAPDIRQIMRLLWVNRLWFVVSILAALSCGIAVHLSESRSFVSQDVLSFSSSKLSPLAGAAGFQTSDDFVPKMNSLAEEAHSAKSCKSLINGIGKERLHQAGIFTTADESSVCNSVQLIPDLEKMQVVVRVHAFHPMLAQATADAAASALVNSDKNHMSRKLRSLKVFLSDQEEQLGKKLKHLENDRTEFQGATNLISVSQAEKTVSEGMEKSEQEYFEYEVKLKANESLIRQTEESIADTSKSLTSNEQTTSSLYLNQIQYRLTMLKYRRNMLGTVETVESKKIDTEIQSILETYKQVLQVGGSAQFAGDPLEYLQTLQSSIKSLKKDNRQLKTHLGSLGANLKKKTAQIASVAGSIQHLGEITREIEVTTSLYVAIEKRLQEVDMELAATVSDLSVLRRAALGTRENSPISRKLLFSLAIAIFANIAFLLGRDMFVPTVKGNEELEAMGLPSIGYIPLVRIRIKSKMPVLLRDAPDSIEADAFRALRLRLSTMGQTLKKPNKAVVVLVTSPLPESGKTFISTNLSYAFGKAGVKTLLVDLDLRRPSISKYFPADDESVTLDKFFLEKKVSDCVTKVTENLDVILSPESKSAAADKLEALILNQFIERASAEYDFIILDLPPVLSVIDPFLLAPHATINLLVVEYRKTHKDDILNSVQQLSALQDVPTIGLINGILPEMIAGKGANYYRTVGDQKVSKSA